jgi:hypothetical protein
LRFGLTGRRKFLVRVGADQQRKGKSIMPPSRSNSRALRSTPSRGKSTSKSPSQLRHTAEGFVEYIVVSPEGEKLTKFKKSEFPWLDPEFPFYWWWVFVDHPLKYRSKQKFESTREFWISPTDDLYEQVRVSLSKTHPQEAIGIDNKRLKGHLLDLLDNYMTAALHWEQARRVDRNPKVPAFNKLPLRIKDILIDAEATAGEPLFNLGKAVRGKNWINITIAVGPSASIAMCKALFGGVVQKESEKRGIKRPKGPQSRTRVPTWRGVQVMDLRDIGHRVLEESDRSALFSVRKEAKEQLRRIRALLRSKGIKGLL